MSAFTEGKIDLSFPENPLPQFIEIDCYPSSYYTLSNKERLVLLVAEIFRLKFSAKYPSRRPILLAAKNECDVQKFVCMTISPTAFYFPKMIRSLEECCNFVADFITYEPLEKPIALPAKLISPDVLLHRRKGNSFEMATLLCSILIGEGFKAMIVSGIAKSETVLNDQRNVECPYLKTEDQHAKKLETDQQKHKQPIVYEDLNDDIDIRDLLFNRSFEKFSMREDGADKKKRESYLIKKPPDLTSNFSIEETLNIEESELSNEEIEEEFYEEELSKKSKILKTNQRTHAWIVVFDDISVSNYKDKKKMVHSKDNSKVFFVEPSTGFRHEITSENYIEIDSVWNNENYYVNCQHDEISKMSWDFSNRHEWESFLPYEQQELKSSFDLLEEQTNVENFQVITSQKHLDLIPSWVRQLNISLQDYDERYPNFEKTVHYKKVIHQKFSPYFQKSGLITRITVFNDENYEEEKFRYEYYQNRADHLNLIKFDSVANLTEECFSRGRQDKLRVFKHFDSSKGMKILSFYEKNRSDALKECQICEKNYVFYFSERDDLCMYQEFFINKSTSELEKITDMFCRNNKLPCDKDIAVRHFCLTQNKIIVKYHYAIGATTALKKEFTKPPKPDYGKEITFTPDLIRTYETNQYQESSTQYENYQLLLKLLEDEENLKQEYTRRVQEIDEILKTRSQELKEPRLTVNLFDPLRNMSARNLRLKQFESELKRNIEDMTGQPDYLEPYLISYDRSKLTQEQSLEIYNACLNDIKSRYSNLLNELHRRYQNLTDELKDLKRFQLKFSDQFDDIEHRSFEEQCKSIELNKRVIQERLVRAHEQAQRKYEEIKKKLNHDPRLRISQNQKE